MSTSDKFSAALDAARAACGVERTSGQRTFAEAHAAAMTCIRARHHKAEKARRTAKRTADLIDSFDCLTDYADAIAEIISEPVESTRFGACVVGIAAMVTGIRARDISGKPRGPKYSQARTAVIIAMQRIAEADDSSATWAECGDAIARDRGSSYRMCDTWRDDPLVLRHAAAIVEKYEAAQ